MWERIIPAIGGPSRQPSPSKMSVRPKALFNLSEPKRSASKTGVRMVNVLIVAPKTAEYTASEM